MADLVTKPVATSIVFDTAHVLELRADLENKTAEVVNLVTGETYTSANSDDQNNVV